MNMPCSSCLSEVVIGSRWQIEGWARGYNLKWWEGAHGGPGGFGPDSSVVVVWKERSRVVIYCCSCLPSFLSVFFYNRFYWIRHADNLDVFD